MGLKFSFVHNRLSELFNVSLKISKFTRICVEHHSTVTGWQELFFPIQILLICGGRCERYFWDTRKKIYRLLNFCMLFQLLPKSFFQKERLQNIDHVTNYCKRPILPCFFSGTRVGRILCSCCQETRPRRVWDHRRGPKTCRGRRISTAIQSNRRKDQQSQTLTPRSSQADCYENRKNEGT